jgi:cell division protein FtsL
MSLPLSMGWTALLILLIVLSAFAVIASTHGSRELYGQLQQLEARRWYLEEEYSRLLLEQSTWASHHRIETVAADDLGLTAPDHQRTRLVAK